jgi:hypothetical protein
MEKLINEHTIGEWLIKGERFHRSHGANQFSNPVYLGTGMLYYTMAYIFQAKLCVCLGSGSGFVPRCMRQAQFDLDMKNSETILVDANLPEAGWGAPDYFDAKPSFFTENFDVKIVQKTTKDAVEDFQGMEIDYLHIDADHSYEGAKHDLLAYSQFMAKKSVITMHDTIPKNAGVWKVIEEMRDNKEFDLVDFPLNMGVAILTRRNDG